MLWAQPRHGRRAFTPYHRCRATLNARQAAAAFFNATHLLTNCQLALLIRGKQARALVPMHNPERQPKGFPLLGCYIDPSEGNCAWPVSCSLASDPCAVVRVHSQLRQLRGCSQALPFSHHRPLPSSVIPAKAGIQRSFAPICLLKSIPLPSISTFHPSTKRGRRRESGIRLPGRRPR